MTDASIYLIREICSIKADVTEGTWNTHEVACILADLMGDNCACNCNGIDEWLPYCCDFAEKECPNVVGVACWEQYLKHIAKKRR